MSRLTHVEQVRSGPAGSQKPRDAHEVSDNYEGQHSPPCTHKTSRRIEKLPVQCQESAFSGPQAAPEDQPNRHTVLKVGEA